MTLRTDLGFVRDVLAAAARTTAYEAGQQYGVHSSTIRRWYLHSLLQPNGWPTDADVEAWRADYAQNAERRAKRAAQVASYRHRRYLARGPLWIDATGTVRRLQALCAIGWTCADLATHLGVTAARVSQITAERHPQVTRDTATAVRAVYDRLSMTVPGHRAAWLHARQRRQAEAKGWAPPLAWDDHTIDDPTARPHNARRTAA